MTTKSRAISAPARTRKRTSCRPRIAPAQPVGDAEERQDERRDRDELEEPVPCVFRIRQARPRLDQGLSSEQVAELNEHEGEKEQVEQRQDDGELGPAERPLRLDLQLERLGLEDVLAEETGADPGEDGDQQDVGQELMGIRDGARHVALEDRVRGHEERAEEQEQRCRQHQPTADSDSLLGLRPLRQLPPVDVPLHQGDRAPGHGCARVLEPDQVVREADTVHGPRRTERAKRERDDEREDVERDEPRRVAPDDEPSEDDEDGQHPPPAAGERRALPAADGKEHGDNRGDPEEEVQPHRGRSQQLVAEEPQKERRPE